MNRYSDKILKKVFSTPFRGYILDLRTMKTTYINCNREVINMIGDTCSKKKSRDHRSRQVVKYYLIAKIRYGKVHFVYRTAILPGTPSSVRIVWTKEKYDAEYFCKTEANYVRRAFKIKGSWLVNL